MVHYAKIRHQFVLSILVALAACDAEPSSELRSEQRPAPGSARPSHASPARGAAPRLTLAPGPVAAEVGALIIPMDTTYQDSGTFRAFGLVYELLAAGIPVGWAIEPGKAFGDPDFTASATDNQTGAVIANHGYRAGPWIIDAADAPAALPIIDAWQVAYPQTTVHVATAPFMANIARYLIAAPSIAMFADGNQSIARTYVQAAHIPDSAGDYAWPDASPDMLSVAEVAGPTDVDHQDGALFDADGDPQYCQLMSMHWGVNNAVANPEVVAEVRSFLGFPTHFFAECQAVNAFENLNPYGFFLTTTGFAISNRPGEVDVYNPDQPFVQFDGAFETVGGSEPSYTIPMGGAYKAGDVVMLTGTGTPPGDHDVWMTGYLDGTCPPDAQGCGSLGKVSYLGGHQYSTTVPISTHANSQGTRLFLNSLFEAPCATSDGHPVISLQKQAPAEVYVPQIDYSIAYTNFGPTVASNVQLVDTLPAGATLVSACCGGVLVGDEVVWDLGNLGAGEGSVVTLTVSLPDYGTYDNIARVDYDVGLTPFSLASSLVSTDYVLEASSSGTTSGGTTGAVAVTGGSSEGSSAGEVTGGGGSSSTGAGSSGGGSASTGAGDTGLDGTAGGGTAGGGTGGSGGASEGGGSASGSGGASGTTVAGAEEGGSGSGSAGSGEGESEGCGCRQSTPTAASWAWLLLGLGLGRRRRGARAA